MPCKDKADPAAGAPHNLNVGEQKGCGPPEEDAQGPVEENVSLGKGARGLEQGGGRTSEGGSVHEGGNAEEERKHWERLDFRASHQVCPFPW